MRKTLAALCGFFIACGIAQAQNSSGTQTLTVANAGCVSGSCVQLKFDSNDVASATISLSGAFTATVVFESSNDGLALTDSNKVWVAIAGTPLNGTTAVTSATTANTWKFNVASSTDIRARCSVFTSAPTVIIKSSRAVANAGGGGTSLPDLTDSSGVSVTSAVPLVIPVSAASNGSLVPGLGETAATTTGINLKSSTEIDVVFSGTRFVSFFSPATSAIALGSAAHFGWSSSTDPAGSGLDAILRRRTAANIQLGAADANGVPVDQTISVQNAITGSDIAGGHLTLDAPLGTGLGAASKISINRAIMKATGTTAQTAQNAFAVGQSKTLSNTSATAQTIATITLGSNAGGGASGIFTLVCTDGTNFDSETQSFNVSFVNKATVVTVGTPAITTSTAANNSGSCTLGITAVASGNDIALKVTPVFGTIVPTTVTLYPIITHSTNTVTFN